MARGAGSGRQSGADTNFIQGVTPGGTVYWYSLKDPDYGYLTNSVLATRYPLSYIYGVAMHTPTGAATGPFPGVEIQAAALGGRIAVIYGQDRVGGDIFFGPWANPYQGNLTVGYGLGEGEIDSLVKIETAAGVVVTSAPIIPVTITNATNANPIVITAAAHGRTTGQRVSIAGVLGNTAANVDGAVITVIDPNSFSLNGFAGNGAYTSGGVIIAATLVGFSGQANFTFYRGVDAPASTDPFFTAITSTYAQTFDERYPGLAFVAASLVFHPDLLNNFPDLRWTVKGRKLLDPRLGVNGNGIPNQPAVWSDNPMLCLVDYFISVYYGVGTPLSEIDWVSVADIASWCDAIQSDGRKRFTFNSTLRAEASHKANIDFIRAHFRCTYARVNGKYKFYVDRPRVSTGVFDEVDHPITNATNASPIVVTCPGHLRLTGDSLFISSITGNTAANGRWTATVIDADTLSLDGSAGNGAYVDGGKIVANCRALHRWRTLADSIPTNIDYKWTDPARDYQPATAKDITAAAQAGTVYTRTATYNADGCRNAGQAQSQATYLLKKRSKDLNHSIVCNRAEGLAVEMYDVRRLNLPSFGISGYYADVIRLTKMPDGEFAFDFEEYDSTIFDEVVVGTQSNPAVTLPDPSAVPPTPAAPIVTQEGLRLKVVVSALAPPYPFLKTQRITVQKAGGSEALLDEIPSGTLYIEGVTMNVAYTVRAYVVSLAAVLSIAAAAAPFTPVMASIGAPPDVVNLTVNGTTVATARAYWDPPAPLSESLYGAGSWSTSNAGSPVTSRINDGLTAAIAFDWTPSADTTITFDSGVGVAKNMRYITEVADNGGGILGTGIGAVIEYSDDMAAWIPVSNKRGAQVPPSGIGSGPLFPRPAAVAGKWVAKLGWSDAGSHRGWRVRKGNSFTQAQNTYELQWGEAGAVDPNVTHYVVNDNLSGRVYATLLADACPTAAVPFYLSAITSTTTPASTGIQTVNFSLSVLACIAQAHSAGITGNPGTFTFAAPGNAQMAFANGLNSDVDISAIAVSVNGHSFGDITGPTTAFSIGGFTPVYPNKTLTIVNRTAQTMTIVNEDASSTAANRITTQTGANAVIAAPGIARFEYSGTAQRWQLMVVRDSGAGDGNTGTGKVVHENDARMNRITLNSPTLPTVALISTAWGVGASAVLRAGSGDMGGVVEITPGSGAASAGIVQVTFTAAVGNGTNTPIVIVTPADNAGQWDNRVTWKVISATQLLFQVQFDNNGTAFNLAGGTLRFHFHMFGK